MINVQFLRKVIYSQLLLSFIILFFTSTINAQQDTGKGWIDLDTVKAKRFDTGKMWTFEDAPLDYFEETYGFRPTQEWLDDVRLSSVRVPGCSGSFVSEDGLLLTNHHCIDGVLQRIQKEGENLARDGFYAPTLEEERKIDRYFADQMVLIKDVTDEISAAVYKAANDEERIEFRDEKIEEIENRYSEETGLRCRITRLYNGGKYSLYGFKRYNDVRAVLFVERIVGLYGGDPDNYTYPRYNSDFALLRVYDDDGKPLKTDNYYKFNTTGSKEGEVLFTIGNPGRTNRLKTMAKLEHFRDYGYKNYAWYVTELLRVYSEMMNEYPDKADVYRGASFGPGNMAKRFNGYLEGLRDPYIMARKANFENTFKAKVLSDPAAAEKYGHLWDAIADGRNELSKLEGESNAFGVNRRTAPQYFQIGLALYNLAKELEKPEDERGENYKEDKIEETINDIFPDNFDLPLERKRLALHIEYIIMNLGADHPVVKKFFDDKSYSDAADDIISKSILNEKEKVLELANSSADRILNSNDPVISFFVNTRERFAEVRDLRGEIFDTESALEDQLGRALFDIYGTSIPPEATFSLRISDGVMRGYEYNGTIAPTFTTFYGLYDRYHSHNKTWPWDLPDRWVHYGSDFNLETMNNFIGTFDIVGGSSGSAIINNNAEYVGIIHDYNIEGLACDIIYSTEKNRAVALSSAGIFEIVKNLFHCSRIANELVESKIVDL